MQNSNLPLRVVCATRVGESEFLSKTPTGRSIKNFIKVSKAEVRLYSNNSTSLSILYNRAIEECEKSPAILVFIHDDILIGDFFWADRIRDGLNQWDIVGLAGNTRIVPGQPSWAFINDRFEWDAAENLSGAVGHGEIYPPRDIAPFGPINQECKLLDGLLLAVNSESLFRAGLRFDEKIQIPFLRSGFL